MIRFNAGAAVVAAFFIVGVPVSLPGQVTTAVTGVRLVDGNGGAAIENANVVIRSGRVVAAGPAATVPVPMGAVRIDGVGFTAIPGLIDAHVHLGATFVTGQGEFKPAMLEPFLAAGVTTIRSTGDAMPWIAELRTQVRAGQVRGPRIITAGPMFTAPGGHPAGTWLKQLPDAAAQVARQVTDADSAVAEVRRMADAKVDLIKVVFDEGDDRSPFGRLPRLDILVMRAIVAEARARGLPSIVHWGNAGQLMAILDAGPDELEHVTVTPIPDSLVRVIAERRIAVTPTVGVFAQFLPPPVLRMVYANVRKLAQAGVPIVAGSDAPLGPAFGTGIQTELDHLVLAGLTPAEALAAATRNAARALRLTDLGTIEAGKRADIVLLGGDPLSAIAATRDVVLVLKDGEVAYRRPPR